MLRTKNLTKPRHPGNQGFDEWFSNGNTFDFGSAKLYHNGEPVSLPEKDNLENRPLQTRIVLDGFNPVNPAASVIQLSGALNETNTPDKPERIVPAERTWVHGLSQGAATYTFPPHSLTMIRFAWKNDDRRGRGVNNRQE